LWLYTFQMKAFKVDFVLLIYEQIYYSSTKEGVYERNYCHATLFLALPTILPKYPSPLLR
jgi:hypothetical protein